MSQDRRRLDSDSDDDGFNRRGKAPIRPPNSNPPKARNLKYDSEDDDDLQEIQSRQISRRTSGLRTSRDTNRDFDDSPREPKTGGFVPKSLTRNDSNSNMSRPHSDSGAREPYNWERGNRAPSDEDRDYDNSNLRRSNEWNTASQGQRPPPRSGSRPGTAGSGHGRDQYDRYEDPQQEYYDEREGYRAGGGRPYDRGEYDRERDYGRTGSSRGEYDSRYSPPPSSGGYDRRGSSGSVDRDYDLSPRERERLGVAGAVGDRDRDPNPRDMRERDPRERLSPRDRERERDPRDIRGPGAGSGHGSGGSGGNYSDYYDSRTADRGGYRGGAGGGGGDYPRERERDYDRDPRDRGDRDRERDWDRENDLRPRPTGPHRPPIGRPVGEELDRAGRGGERDAIGGGGGGGGGDRRGENWSRGHRGGSDPPLPYYDSKESEAVATNPSAMTSTSNGRPLPTQGPSMASLTSPSSHLSFVHIAHERGFRTEHVQCVIVRDRSSITSKLYPSYELIVEETRQPLIVAQKMNMNRTSNYHLFDMTRGQAGSKLSKKSGNYLGKLRAKNINRTEYSLVTQSSEREEVAGVMFDRLSIINQIKEGSQPRKMTVIVPPLDTNNVPIPNKCESTGGDDMAVGKGSFGEMLRNSNFYGTTENGIRILESKDPVFENGNYRLNFRGRVSVPSVKNFQLISLDSPDDVICQFGKVGEDRFHLDYKAPLNAFQAFALALCQFNL